MPTDQSLDTINNSSVQIIAGTPAWAMAQKQSNDISHAGRNDKFSEMAYQNAVSHQNISNQSALDHVNSMRAISKMFIAAIGEKIVSLDPSESMAIGQLFKANADSSILSTLSQLSGGQIGTKVAQTTPPTSASDTGFASLLSMVNTLNQQNYSNNMTNSSLASTVTALASVLTKIAESTPPK